MKKITLLCLIGLSFVFTSRVIAQTLNQNAGWPNAAWVITGTYTVAAVPGDAFEADPTVSANFSYNDDDNATGGDQSFDDIAAESPVIDLTAASGAGETLISIAGNYVYNRVDVVGELLTFQYWDADATNWVNYPGGLFDAARETVSQPTDDLCLGTSEPYTTDTLDISGFSATQLSGFRYRIFYDDDFDGGNAWEYGFCFDAPTITSSAPLTCTQVVVNGTSIVNDCVANSEFQIDVDVDLVSDGTFINDGTTTYAIVAGSNLVGPYASGTNVTLTIEHSDSACDFALEDVTFTCPTIPTVAGTLSVNGCLDSDSFTTAYDASVQNIYWIQLDYDGGCFELTADTDGSDFDTELGLYDLNGVLVANNDDDAGGITPQSLFTEEALPAGTYYLAAGAWNAVFGVDNFNVTSTQAATTGTLVVNASTPSDNTVDFCNLQFPFEGNIEVSQDHVVYTQVYEDGVTNPQGEQGLGIEAWIGISETDASTTADFTSGDWTWIVADYNANGPASNNDEYSAEIGSTRAEGTYYYVSRYSIDGGPFSYGGINPGGSDGNFWDGNLYVSGELTVSPPSPPANDECSAAEMLTVNADLNCTVVTAGTTAGATASAEDDAGTSGTPNTDVWYSFVATGPAHRIELSNIVNIGGASTSLDMGMTLYDATGSCAGLVFVQTSDPNAFTAIDLFPGTTYFVRVYGWATVVQYNNFDICVGTPDPVAQGSYCSDAIVVGALPYTATDDTGNYGDDYTGAPGTDCGSVSTYLNGDDVVYEYTATSDTSVNISLTGIGSTYAGVFAYNNCADIGEMCATEGDVNEGTTDDLEFDLTVTNGETYYIVISTWAAPQATTYTLNIVENTCTDSTINYIVVNDCDTSGGFLIDVEVTDLGSATNITIVNDQDATVYNVSVTGTYQFGPYVNATDVIVSVSDDNDVNCFQNSGVLTQAVCPPDNVDCSTAETVAVGIGEDGPTVVGTNDNAGDSGVPDPSCNAFYEGGDIWYEFTVPVGATEVYVDVESSAFSSIIAALYDNCADLNEVSCEVIFSSSASFHITGLTGGATYYLRLYDFGNDSIGLITFNINTPALSIDEFDTLGFKYFPNPVTNTLTLKAQQSIQNVTVFNMLGQEVLRTSPNTLESSLNMSSLNTGSYFVKVTINDATETVRIIKN